MYRISLAIPFALFLAPLALAQDAPRFRWHANQVLLYRTEHATAMTETMGEDKSESKTVVRTTKRWQVTAVDSQGVATMQLSLTTMRQERQTTSGDKLVYDSAEPDKATPELKNVLSRYLNKTIAVLRVDGYGRVVEIKESLAPKESYEQELPFLLMLPGALPKPGQVWERSYKITLAPPLGTGEKYDTAQKYTCAEAKDGLMKLSVKTDLKDQPKAPADAIPLWQMLPEGEIVFDLKAGRLKSAAFAINKELKQGENGTVKFVGRLTVELTEK